MTTSSRNPFADPNLPSLADLISRIALDGSLPLRQRQNQVWAMRLVARVAKQDPAQIPAHPEYLRSIWKKAAPASLGITRPAWNNARSLIGKVLEAAGLASMPAHYQAPFSPEWQQLWDALPPGKNALRMQLSRLLHYCSAQRIAPTEVDDQILADFNDALTAESIVELPYEIYRGAARSWNNVVDQIAGWPQQRLSVPSNKTAFSLPWDAFPPSLRASVAAYLRRAGGLDLDDEHFTRAQRAATLKTREWQLRMLATAIHRGGVALERLTDLGVLMSPELVSQGLQYLLDRNGGVTYPQLSDVAGFVPTLARRLDLPQTDIARLKKMARKVKIVRRGMTERNREALRAFDDERLVEALLNLPHRLLGSVQAGARKGVREARQIQSALAIELLLNAPVRIRNLASIEIERHLVETGSRGQRQLHLRFPAPEVKNVNDLEYPLLSETVELLDTYIRDWRPLLLSGPSCFLFPGKDPGQHKGSGALSGQIKATVHAFTGLDMPAHRFRHAAGKIFLDRHPGQYEVVRQLLGHKSIATTISFYAGAETVSAARHYAETILSGRNRVPGGGRR
jgi:integrase